MLERPLPKTSSINTNTNGNLLSLASRRKPHTSLKGLSTTFSVITERFDNEEKRISYGNIPSALSCLLCLDLLVRKGHLRNPTTQPLNPTTLFQDNLEFSGSSQDHQALKKSLTATGLGRHGSSQDLLKTERVGFEPTRVLPLHDFESCAFNRALPPLQALQAPFHFSRQPSHTLSTQPIGDEDHCDAVVEIEFQSGRSTCGPAGQRSQDSIHRSADAALA